MRTLGIALLVALATAPFAASADPTNATLSVTAAVAANCIVRTKAAVEFGTYNTAEHARGGPLDVTAQAVSIACTKGAAGVSIGLDQGEFAHGAHRGMEGGAGSAPVAYDIYTTEQRSTVWNAVNTVAYAPQSSRPVSIPLYGRIPAGQTVAPGRYADVLLAMVNF